MLVSNRNCNISKHTSLQPHKFIHETSFPESVIIPAHNRIILYYSWQNNWMDRFFYFYFFIYVFKVLQPLFLFIKY